MTVVAAALGVVAIGVGIAKPDLFQIKVMGLVAIGALALSACAIVLSVWQVERRSRRLRQPIFWLSLLLNLIILAAVGFLYRRGIGLPSLQHDHQAPLEAPYGQ